MDAERAVYASVTAGLTTRGMAPAWRTEGLLSRGEGVSDVIDVCNLEGLKGALGVGLYMTGGADTWVIS